MLTGLLSAGLLESVTVKVSGVAFADAVGVPLITPVVALIPIPAGNVPLVSAHVYGVLPPLATSVALYAVPTSPLGSEVVVITSVLAAATVSARFTVLVC